jgi:hypothetical protein
MTKADWTTLENKMDKAAALADGIIKHLELEPPIDPFKVVESESPLLRIGGGDFKNLFDGKLEYHPNSGKFLLFYNTKYNRDSNSEKHHPRTRFSICHELGHYFIEHHHTYLTNGGLTHNSTTEFISKNEMEREADSFAARLLMPSEFVRPEINQGELNRAVINRVAAKFEASITSAALRCVKASNFPSALACIRKGQIDWFFGNDPLRDGKCYPRRDEIRSEKAKQEWNVLLSGEEKLAKHEARVHHWFETYNREDLEDLYVAETYFQIPATQSLLVLLTINEDDLFPD